MKNKKKPINSLRAIILAVATLSIIGCNQKSQASDATTIVKSKRPNILLIVADDTLCPTCALCHPCEG